MQSKDETSFSLELVSPQTPPLKRTRSQAVEGEEPVPAPFRFNIGGVQGDKSNCFRPKQLEGQDMSNVQHRMLGQVYAGKYHETCKNPKAAVVWEVPRLQLCRRCF